MKLSSSDGTSITIEELKEVREKLGNVLERVIEVNNGTYKNEQEAIQFDYVTCPELANEIDRIKELTNRLSKLVFQE